MLSSSLIKYVDSNLGNCTNNIEVAYTIYLLLCKKLEYDPSFAHYKNKDDLLDVSDVTLENPYVICDNFSIIYKLFLDRYGINSTVIISGDMHYLVELEIDNIKITADATTYIPICDMDILSDLVNVKIGSLPLFFRLKKFYLEDDKYKFYSSINSINEKFNLNDLSKIYRHDIELFNTIDYSLEDKINYFINLVNYLYSKCEDEVGRRQIFDCYYHAVFNDEDLKRISVHSFSDDRILSKYIIGFDEIYYAEFDKGFRTINDEEFRSLLLNSKIKYYYNNIK